LRAGRPVVSNVFFGPLIKRHFVAVIVPLPRNGTPDLVISVGLPLQKFAEILESLDIHPNQYISVIDRNGTIVTHSESHARFAGTKIRNYLAPDKQSISKGINREGIEFHWFNQRSEMTGWSISVGIPDSILEGPSRRAMAGFVAATGILVALAIGLAFYWGGRVSRYAGKLGIDREPTREEFEILFESAPNGVMVIGGDGMIFLANSRLENTFGYSRGELIGIPVDTLVPERFRGENSGLRATPAFGCQESCTGCGRELLGQRKDGSEFSIEVSLNPITTGDGELVMATVVDITERKRAQEELEAASASLRLSEQQRLFALEAADIGVWSWDIANDDRFWSDRYKQLIGVPPETKPDRDVFLSRIHPSDRAAFEEYRERAFAEFGRYEVEFRIVGPDDDRPRWLSSKGALERDEAGNPVRMHGVFQDITQRKEFDRERQALQRSIMRAQEQERMRLARELHDQTGQSLAAITLELKAIENSVDQAHRERLDLIRLLLEQMGQVLHQVAWELRPASIDELGLATAAANYVAEWSAQYSVEVDFHCGDGKLDELAVDMRITIYRIIQETLTNIAKHARATLVSVLIERVDAVLQLTIEDNGCGFDAASTKAQLGNRHNFGLAGMEERLSLVGGGLQIESSLGVGTTIYVRIPLLRERKAA
jgi:PAS domain S-box-containing protein